MTLLLWTMIAGLLVVNSIALVFLGRLRSENQSLRAQVAAAQKTRQPPPQIRPNNRTQQITKAAEEKWILSTNERVSILLGENESGGGLTHLDQERDGLTTMATLDGISCRYLNLKAQKAKAFLYFSIDPAFKTGDLSRIVIEIEYFDGARGTLGLHYDASKSKNNPAAYTDTRTTVMTGTKTWKTSQFQLSHPTFRNSQNGGADFRIWVAPAELYVRRVIVARAEPEPNRVLPAPDSFTDPLHSSPGSL